ncbi:SseB family protein [Primorskyibacter sp. 2E233]|uniref:SseB family protein n=1 Tax=Primorskyibacter sp. 2E233 TaxID=3413431 RepID=UPI003BF10B6E
MTMTPIDTAHAAMEAAPEDDAARLRFYERLADAELFLMLTEEPKGDNISPEVFEVQDSSFVLVFDLEERLSGFAGRAVPYVAMSGRALARMLAGQGIGLALNIEVAPSAILLPPQALEWLSQTLDHGPSEGEARPESLHAPRDLPEALLQALDTKLAATAGLARKAYLARVTYEGGTQGHLLGITGAVPGAEAALAKAINEALVFSGLEAGALDVAFLADSDPLTAQLAGVALRFDLPEPPKPERIERIAPGSDPDKPPLLR